jgi:uncharacterized membrane protein
MSEPESGDREPTAPGEVARLARAVEELDERVARLESRANVEAPPRRATRTTRETDSVTTFAPTSTEASAPPDAASKRSPRPKRERPAWRVGPLRNLEKEHLPVVLMGASGGIALLMGALYFTWYSIQRGWISPEVRVTTSALLGLAALAGAWRLAPRGQRAVASGLGGAGLGAWFGAILVARHSHELLGPPATFVLLALGAAAGVLVATHRRLRLLASLGALGAFLTPLVVGSGEDRLHELMSYQLVVVAFLYVVEDRRRWPELGHIASVTTWILLLAWSTEHLQGGHRGRMLVWSFVFLGVGHAQALVLLARGNLARMHAAPRLWIHGWLAWIAALIAAQGDHPSAHASLGMALLNGAFALGVFRLAPARGRWSRFFWRASISGCLSVAWVQLHVFGLLRLDDDGTLFWWTAMAVVATAVHVRLPSFGTFLPILLPFATGVVWSLERAGDSLAWVGFVLASLPFAIALWPGREGLARASARLDRYLASMLVAGALVWATMAWEHLEEATPRAGWFVLLCLLAGAAITLRAAGAPSRPRCQTTLFLLAALVVTSMLVSAGAHLFDPTRGFGSERVWQIGALLGVAGLAVAFSAVFRGEKEENDWRASVFDRAGLLRPLALVVVAMLLVSGVIPSLTEDRANARSLNQAGWSVCWAVAGLVLLLRGLFGRRTSWRRVGITVLFVTAAKLVVFDLTQVSMVWRVLSFVGLGLCMLLGAYAYRRLASSLESEVARAGD